MPGIRAGYPYCKLTVAVDNESQVFSIEVSLRTKPESKAAQSAAALSDRLERYWDSLRVEMIYSRELGLRVVQDA